MYHKELQHTEPLVDDLKCLNPQDLNLYSLKLQIVISNGHRMILNDFCNQHQTEAKKVRNETVPNFHFLEHSKHKNEIFGNSVSLLWKKS